MALILLTGSLPTAAAEDAQGSSLQSSTLMHLGTILGRLLLLLVLCAYRGSLTLWVLCPVGPLKDWLRKRVMARKLRRARRRIHIANMHARTLRDVEQAMGEMDVEQGLRERIMAADAEPTLGW